MIISDARLTGRSPSSPPSAPASAAAAPRVSETSICPSVQVGGGGEHSSGPETSPASIRLRLLDSHNTIKSLVIYDIVIFCFIDLKR